MTRSFLEALKDWTDVQPDKSAFSFLNDLGEIVHSVNFGQLTQQTNNVAAYLLETAKLAPGDRVLLVYPPSLDFIISFIGCLKAGVVAVPVFPPNPAKLDKDLGMFVTISNSCEAKTALTCNSYNYATKIASLKSLWSTKSTKWPELNWIVTDAIFSNNNTNNAKYTNYHNAATANENAHIAFLQYTSGSTSDPKGVIITHENLKHNLNLIITGT